MKNEQLEKLYEVTKKQLNFSLNMMKELIEINSNDDTLKIAKTYLSDHIEKCKDLLKDIIQDRYEEQQDEIENTPFELKDDNNENNNVIEW